MESFVSNLRSLVIDTYTTSLEAVNIFELGVVPFISRHFVLPTDVDTFRTLLPGEDHPLEAEVSTLRSSRPEEAHPFEQEVSLTLGPSRLEEDYPFSKNCLHSKLQSRKIPQWPLCICSSNKKFKSSRHQGHLSLSLGRVSSQERW